MSPFPRHVFKTKNPHPPTTTHTHTVHCLSQKDFVFRFSCIAFLCFRNFFFFLTERRCRRPRNPQGLCGDHFLRPGGATRGQSAPGPTLRAADPGAFKGALWVRVQCQEGPASVASETAPHPCSSACNGADRQGALRAAPGLTGSRSSSRLCPVLRSDIQVAAAHHHTSLLLMVTSHSHRPEVAPHRQHPHLICLRLYHQVPHFLP